MVATIAVDAMGGDDAPGAIVAGAAEASLTTECEIVLVGEEAEVARLLGTQRHDPARIRIFGAKGAIPMDASPRAALDAQPDASLPTAVKLVAGKLDGPRADALVSAGNTGAVILACADHFARIAHVKRTALAAVIPTERRRGAKDDPFTLLLDAGATLRVGPRDLASFGMMGAAYASIVSKNPRPRVALLSNGREPTKGTEEIIAAHAFLAKCTSIDFIGNIEGIDIPRGAADVIVTDGFTGNITLKMLEGVHETVMNLARFAYRSKLSWKLALMLLSSGIRRLKEVTDWQQYGGAPILGFDRLCIKAHGRSGPRAIRNAIKVALRCVEQDLAGRIAKDVSILEAETHAVDAHSSGSTRGSVSA
ncbi:phosphate acyltransferase PlsX [Myxococcota bacterium]|nr:phosphate acyltransferase PlsX [Myxococcota bacterium]